MTATTVWARARTTMAQGRTQRRRGQPPAVHAMPIGADERRMTRAAKRQRHAKPDKVVRGLGVHFNGRRCEPFSHR